MSDYNGWENYPTWCVHLWLTNDEGLYTHSLDLVKMAKSRRVAEEAFKNLLDETNPLANSATMFTDLLNHSISQVNWSEIIDAFEEELKDEAEEEDYYIKSY